MQAVALLIAVLLPLALGGLGSLITVHAVRTWYPTLVRPSFAPPLVGVRPGVDHALRDDGRSQLARVATRP